MSTMTRLSVSHSAVILGGALLASVAVAGCSSGSSGSASAASSAPAAGGAAYDSAGVAGTKSEAVTTDGNAAPLTVTADRSIVIHADTTVRVTDVNAATTRLTTIAAEHRATIATQATSNGVTPVPIDQAAGSDGLTKACASVGCPSGYASSVTTLRVANSGVDALLNDVAAMGTVEASARTSDDVTADVADVAARVANARASLARVRALMDRATTVGDVVALEGEMSKRQGDLEALEARQRTLADQSAQATVSVTLLSTDAPAPVSESDTGFLAGLRTGWNAFTSALTASLTLIGAAVPFLVVLIPLALIARWGLRRSRRAATEQTTSA